jgi:soluble lytic murein transglycosylase
VARLRLVAVDYHNSYYGRLAVTRLKDTRGGAVTPTLQRVAPAPAAVPTAGRIATLLSVGLNREAMGELQYAQRIWGDSPQLQATIALTHRRIGNVRAGINAMKRAYPQYLSEQGHLLPVEARKVLFPLDYWPLIRRHSGQRGLDPYLIAALVAQESTFDADVRSSANAYGLMQIVPSTGRRLARTLGIRRFSTSKLTDPDINVRMGTLYYKNLVNQFGGDHYALASYNAGESRVVRWIAERGELPRDEFIDDIPFPETQNYVKKILGTAEDYRLLYPASTASRAAGN